MTRPRIGISLDAGGLDEGRRLLELNSDYPDAIFRAGGLPLLLPHVADPDAREEYLSQIDGLLIPGGNDCDPTLYGQTRHPASILMDRRRQDSALALLALAERRNMPVLGICLGYQLMNILRGGTLHQSIQDRYPESSVVHTRIAEKDPANPTRSSFHEVMIRPDTHLHAIYQARSVRANSRHRQGVDQLGRGLIPAAFAPDGILEALEDYSLPFFVGVQWHPENMVGTEHDALFNALVEAAKEHLK
jgi:putative glutamine amidotransferase